MRYQYRASFTDVDYARQLFSGDYYHWAERAFGAWQHDCGLPLRQLIEHFGIGLPSTETRCHYLGPISFEDDFEVAVGVRNLDEKGFSKDFEIVRTKDRFLAAYGYLLTRFISFETRRPPATVPDEVMRIFRAMEAQNTLPSYEERIEEWKQKRSRNGSQE